MNVKAETIWCCIHIDVIFEYSKIKGNQTLVYVLLTYWDIDFGTNVYQILFNIRTEFQQSVLDIIFHYGFQCFNDVGTEFNNYICICLFLDDQLFETFKVFAIYLEYILFSVSGYFVTLILLKFQFCYLQYNYKRCQNLPIQVTHINYCISWVSNNHYLRAQYVVWDYSKIKN